jgi:large repetitive protein
MRLKALVIATTLMAYAAPAMAQGVEIHDHSKGKHKDKGTVQVGTISEAKVTGFSPTTGPIGTVVTITGANFLQQTKVKVGGRPVKLQSFTPTALTFAIPDRYYDGVITLHHPGSGNPIPVGTFQVQVDPHITSFNPRTGPYGTRVELNGEGFLNGDQVLFNNKPLQTTEFGPNRIIVLIPQGATSDEFTLQRPSNGYHSHSREKFVVSMPAPTVNALSPTQGPPGTQVRISGQYFSGDERVFYGQGRPINIVARGDAFIDVKVPDNARQSNPFTIKSSRGQVQTPVFVLVVNPTISGFSPEYGGAGTQVEIYGSSFNQGDQVYFNGKPIKRVAYADDRVKVEIPGGATTDRFVIWRNGQAAATANKPFQVQNAPTIAGFSPTQGPGGTKVEIKGDNFERDARVTYGNQQLQVVGRRGDHEIHVIVPGNAGNQPFTVSTRGGSVTSASSFQVIDYSNIIAVSPDRGPTGTKVTISQQGYTGNDTFWLGNVALPILEKSNGRYVVQIPANAQTGRVEWESYGKRQTSQYVFTVVKEATFAPATGPKGTKVTIVGDGFTRNTDVRLGNTPQYIVARTSNRIVIMVEGKPQTDYFYLVEGNTTTKLNPQFQLTPSPLPTFAPTSAVKGTRVNITGTGFTRSTTVRYGNAPQNIISRSDKLISFVIDGKPGTDYLYVVDGNESTKLEPAFTLSGPPAPTFAPTTGPAGTRIIINGTGFSPKTQVRLGNKTMNPVVRTPTRIEIVAEGDPGPVSLYVVEGNDVMELPGKFTVQGAPKPSPPPPGNPPPPPPPPPPAQCSFAAAPAVAGAGQTVTIDTTNCNVKNVKQGWFRGDPVQIVSVNANAVVVRLPAKASGTDHIAIETDDGKGVAVRQRTSNKITVKGGY